jgi:hypothetical protein
MKGGSSFFGGAGVGGHPRGGNIIHANDDKAAYGSGGPGGYTSNSTTKAARGKHGVVVVYEYT